MPWADKVKGILNCYLGGEASGSAAADILFGDVNPSGKLAETYPLSLSDNPSYNYYPGHTATVEYRESVFVGYRYYDTAHKNVRFPFGYGLSYTNFEYSDLKLSADSIKDTDTLTVSFKVKNTGDVDGAEIAQVYVTDNESTIYRPEQELRGFKKVFLKAGEEKEITVELGKRAFAYYNVDIHDWHVESGKFTVKIGASSRDIKLTAEVNVESTVEATIPDYRATAPKYYTADIAHIKDEEFVAVLGRELPPTVKSKDIPLDITDNFENASHTKWGGRLYGLLNKVVPEGMARAIAVQTPIRDFISMSGGVFSEQMAEGLLKILNGEKKGLRMILKDIPRAVKGIGPLLKNI